MANTNNAFESVAFFTNTEAQDFAFRLRRDGVNILVETLEARQTHAQGRICRVLAACEVVAVANGHIDPDAGRSRLAEEWLVDSGYMPDTATTDLAINRLSWIRDHFDVQSKLRIGTAYVESLAKRLAMPPQRVKRKPPDNDRASFRALAKWINTSQGEIDDGPRFDRRGNARVVLVYVTVNAASKLINYGKVNEFELWLNNSNDPKELAAALKILLRGWRNTLHIVKFDHVPDLTISDDERQPPFRALTKCRTELADLPALEQFETQNMYFNDDVLQEVCRNPQLKIMNIVNAKITPDGFRRMAACETLEQVYVSRCPTIRVSDRDYLAGTLPNVRNVTISKPREG